MSSMPDLPSPDPWAIEAAAWPLAFAQVREDPRLDMELARKLPPGATVVMIASGGDTAACLGRLPLTIHLVDMNPAQIALARMKWWLASTIPSDEAAGLLGHLPMNPFERHRGLARIQEELGLEADVFGPPDRVAECGPDHCGRYESTFAELRGCLATWKESLDELLASPMPVAEFDATPLAAALDEAFTQVMSLQNLVRLFGREATQNPLRPFSAHFAARTCEIIARLAPRSNPFLHQILAGNFPPAFRYDWLQARHALRARPEWHLGKMNGVLESMRAGSADLIHLSNILDWLTPSEAWATLAVARRVLRPGGKVILRQLNSSLEIQGLDSGIVWDTALGHAMERRDRSFFYPQIHVGTRP
jgi:S-adenosylmethionine-diacylglycerol 3-amino-3-carboxypropyl transferase